MRIKLIGRLANAKGNWEAGEVITVTEAEGQSLVRARAAVALQDSLAHAPIVQPEAAVVEPTETATLARPRGRKRPQEG